MKELKNSPELLFLVEMGYDNKFVMDAEGVQNLLNALSNVRHSYSISHNNGRVYEFKDPEAEIIVKMVTAKRLAELGLEATLKRSNT